MPGTLGFTSCLSANGVHVWSACAAAASMWLQERSTAHGQPSPSRALLPACNCHLPSICLPGCSILYRHVDNPHRLYANYQVEEGTGYLTAHCTARLSSTHYLPLLCWAGVPPLQLPLLCACCGRWPSSGAACC